MAKGKLSAKVTYDLYGPQKGYDDPVRSLHVLTNGLNAVATAREFKRMNLHGNLDVDKGTLSITDRATGNASTTSIHYKDGERYARVMFEHMHDETVTLEVRDLKFWNYRGGDVMRVVLRHMRGPIERPEPIRGDNDMTTYQAAKFLGIKESKLSSMRQDPYGPVWYKEGHRIYFPREQLAEWKAENLPGDEGKANR